MINKICYSLFILLACTSCIKDEIDTDNVSIFNAIWDEMDARYGGFQVRNIDWDDSYTRYAPLVNSSLTELELFQVCTDMLDELDDQHIGIRTSKIDGIEYGFSSGKANDEVLADKEFRLANILNNYLEDGFVTEDFGEDNVEFQFAYGIIKDKNIGYIHFPHFETSSDDWHLQIDDATTFLKDTDGMIVDVRNNGGGFPIIDRHIAARFMKDDKFIFTIESRNGPDRNDFDEPAKYNSTPAGVTYTKPIIALINKSTVSAGEEFMLYMQSQDHVTVMGTPTSNAFSGVGFDRFLPNGWLFRLPVQLYKYPDGSSPEGVGILPEITMQNDTIDINNGIDRIFEKAVEMF